MVEILQHWSRHTPSGPQGTDFSVRSTGNHDIGYPDTRVHRAIMLPDASLHMDHITRAMVRITPTASRR